MTTSILKVDAIQHTAQSTPNIILDANGSVTFANTLVANSYSIISATANAAISIGSTDNTNWILENDLSAGNLVVTRRTAGVRKEALRIDTNGAVTFANNVTFAGTSTFNNLSTTGTTTIGDGSGDGLTINAGTTTFTQGTANGVLYLNGSKVATSGSALTFDGTAILTIGNSNAALVSTGNLYLDATGGGAVNIRVAGSSPSIRVLSTSEPVFAVNSTEQMRLTSKGLLVGYTSDASLSGTGNAIFSGNVGIGTSSPIARLTVAGTGRFQSGTEGIQVGHNGTIGFIETSGNVATPVTFYIAGSEKMRLDQSGNLGLGVTPSAWRTDVSFKAIQMPGGTFAAYLAGGLDPTPNIAANGYVDSGGTWRYINSRAASWYIQNGGMHAWYNAPTGAAGAAILFNQAMTLNASGNLIVGDTGTSAYLDGRFNAISSGGQPGICAKIDPAGNSTQFVYSAWAPFTTGNNVFMSFVTETAGTVRGTISYNRGAGLVAYNTSSDQRLKTNVEPAGSAIQSVLDFPVDQFDWIDSGSHTDFGGVAQKVVNVIPEMVSVPEDEDEMWGIDWSKAVPRLIRAYQELHAEIETLKQRIH